MGMSMGHLILLLVIVLVIFGAGKIPQIMGDVAKGLKAFKEGMREGDKTPDPSSTPRDEKAPIKTTIIDHHD